MPSDPNLRGHLILEIDELLEEVNDVLWLWHGRPIWIYRKLQFCPETVSFEDGLFLKELLLNIPNMEQLKLLRALISSQIRDEKFIDTRERMAKLDRGIVNIQRGRKFISEMSKKVNELIMKQMNIGKIKNGKEWKTAATLKSPATRGYRSRKIIFSIINKIKSPKNTTNSVIFKDSGGTFSRKSYKNFPADLEKIKSKTKIRSRIKRRFY